MNAMQPLLLIGAGGHARSVADAAAWSFRPAAYSALEKADDSYLGRLRYVGDDEACLQDGEAATLRAIITAGVSSDGSLKLRRKLIRLYGERSYATIISPHACVSPSATLGDGCAILAMATVNCGCSLGKHCVVNTGAIVEHDCILGENVFIAPGAVVCGGVEIEDDVFVGAGAILRPGIRICSKATVGMGAVVTTNIRIPGVYAGVPAKIIK